MNVLRIFVIVLMMAVANSQRPSLEESVKPFLKEVIGERNLPISSTIPEKARDFYIIFKNLDHEALQLISEKLENHNAKMSEISE